MPLEPKSAELVQQAKAAGAKPYAQMTPEEARASVAGFADHFGPGPELARVDNLLVDVEGGQIPVRSAVARRAPGGDRPLSRWRLDAGLDRRQRHHGPDVLAHRSGCAVVVFGYRLTPDHPLPKPVEDSWAAL